MYLNLEDLKKHLNIDEDFHDDDKYILSLAETAEVVVERHIGYKLQSLCDESGLLPAPLVHAMKLLVGSFYMNRESVSGQSMTEIPLAYQYLLGLFENYQCWG